MLLFNIQLIYKVKAELVKILYIHALYLMLIFFIKSTITIVITIIICKFCPKGSVVYMIHKYALVMST